MNNTTLIALLQARSVAIVGASDKPGSFGGQALRNLVDMGYPGQIYGIHPRLTEIYGCAGYPSLTALPERPDCIALAVANHHLVALLEEAAGLGIPAAVVFGDPNVGAGRDPRLASQIAEIGHSHGMAICGPNAMGVYNLHHHFAISGYPVRSDKPAGSVALITHSGTVFDAMSQNNRDVNFSYVISCGNEAVLTAADYLHFVLGDPTTKVAACYLETVRDPEGFIAALEVAVARQIPVIALKVGLSERGQAMAQAHTGALAGGAETYAALFRRYGVRQVFSLDEMMDTVELFSQIQRIPGPNLSLLMESGGERSMVVDLADELDLSLTAFTAETNTRLEMILEEGVVPDNPLDAFGTGVDVVGVYRECLRAMHDDPNTGLLVLAVDLARDSYLSPAYVEAALSVYSELTKPFLGLVNLSAGAGESLMAHLRGQGIPVLMGTETGLRALRHLIDYNAFIDHPTPAPEFLGRPDPNTVAAVRAQIKNSERALDEHASKAILAAYGLPVTHEILVTSVEAAVEMAEQIGYPVVLKTAQPEILHKSEVEGIHLNLVDGQAVRRAYQTLADQLGSTVLVQEMVAEGVEMILGMTHDPQFGPVMVIGLGGIFVEILADVQTVMPPLSRAEAEDLPTRLRGYALLQGARGRPLVDQAALTDTLLRFSTFVTDCGDLLVEVDVNPLILRPSGAVVVDALVVPR